MNPQPQSDHPSVHPRPGLLRLVKETLRISKIVGASLPGGELARAYLRLQLGGGRNARPYRARLGPLTLVAPSHYDFFELYDEIFLAGAYAIRLPIDNPSILDCGANCGFATAWYKLLFPGAHITCFEPDPEVFPLLKENVAVNRFSEVTPVNAACGAADGTTTFYQYPGYSLAGSSHLADPAKGIRREVRTVNLADYVPEQLDLLKLDVEGAEWEVMRHLAATGALKRVKHLALEYHHRLYNDRSELGGFLKILEDAGFQYNLFVWRLAQQYFDRRWETVMIYAFQS